MTILALPPQLAPLLVAAAPVFPDAPLFGAPVVYVAAGLLGLVLIGTGVLHFIELWQKVVVRRGGTGAAHIDSDGGKLAVEITGFVASKDFEDHKRDAKDRDDTLQREIDRSRKEWEAGVEKALKAALTRDETADRWREVMSSDMRTTALKVAAVETKTDMIVAAQNNLGTKIDRFIERHIPQPTA